MVPSVPHVEPRLMEISDSPEFNKDSSLFHVSSEVTQIDDTMV